MSTIIVIAAQAARRRILVEATASAMPGWRVDHASQPALLISRPPGHEYELMLLSVGSLDDIHQTVVMARVAYLPKSILLLSDHAGPATWSQGLPLGVVGCVPHYASTEMLQAAIKLVLSGGMVFPAQFDALAAPPAPADSAPDTEPAAPPLPPAHELQEEGAALGLTPRQYEVLVLLARGYSLKAIGRQLNIAVTTAKVHAETVYQRLHVHNRTEAVYAAISRGATLGWSSMARQAASDA